LAAEYMSPSCRIQSQMDHDTLDRMRQSHAAWRVLVADNAPLILSFFILCFIRPNRRAIPAPEITAQLGVYLDNLREMYPERYPRSAREYLEDWAAPNRSGRSALSNASGPQSSRNRKMAAVDTFNSPKSR